MPPPSVFWPFDETCHGFVFGWRRAHTFVVSGVKAFPNRVDAQSALLRLNNYLLTKKSRTQLALEILGTCSQSSSCPAHVLWEGPPFSTEQTRFVLYRRPKQRSKRYYSLNGIDLDLLLSIQPCDKSKHLDDKLSLSQSSQAAFLIQRHPLSTGINASLLDQMNMAYELMLILEDFKASMLPSDKPLKQSASWRICVSSFMQKLHQHTLSILLSREDSVCLWGFGAWIRPMLASAQQTDLRREQVTFILQQVWLLRNSEGPNSDVLSAHYISTQNCIWLILNDIIIGTAVGVFLIENRLSLAKAAYHFSKFFTVTLVRSAIHWLDNWPAGLKLNTELSRFLFLIFHALIDTWEAILRNIKEVLPIIILFHGASGVLGMTMILALLSDMISMLTVHFAFSYTMIRIAFKNQLVLANSLFKLFRGKRYNVLRCRLDDWNYDLDQLLLGAMLFTLVSFFFPTISVYYMVFALARLAVISLQASFEVALALINHFPLFALTLRAKDPWRLPGGIVFYSSYETSFKRPCFVMQNSPIPLSTVFSQYAVLGSRLFSYYSPDRLIIKLLNGDRLDPIPRHWIRYAYDSERRNEDRRRM